MISADIVSLEASTTVEDLYSLSTLLSQATIKQKSYDYFTANKKNPKSCGRKIISHKTSKLDLIDYHTLTSLPLPPPPSSPSTLASPKDPEVNDSFCHTLQDRHDQLCLVEDYIEDSDVVKTIKRKQSIANVKRSLLQMTSQRSRCVPEGVMETGEIGLGCDSCFASGFNSVDKPNSGALSLLPTTSGSGAGSGPTCISSSTGSASRADSNDSPVTSTMCSASDANPSRSSAIDSKPCCSSTFDSEPSFSFSSSSYMPCDTKVGYISSTFGGNHSSSYLSESTSRSCSDSTILSNSNTLVEPFNDKLELLPPNRRFSYTRTISRPVTPTAATPTVATTRWLTMPATNDDYFSTPSKRPRGENLESIFGKIPGTEFLKHCDICEKPLYELSSLLSLTEADKSDGSAMLPANNYENFICGDCTDEYEELLQKQAPPEESNFDFQLQVVEELRKRQRQQGRIASTYVPPAKRLFQQEVDQDYNTMFAEQSRTLPRKKLLLSPWKKAHTPASPWKKACLPSFLNHRSPFGSPKPRAIAMEGQGFSDELVTKLQNLELMSDGRKGSGGELWDATKKRLRWRWRVKGLLPNMDVGSAPKNSFPDVLDLD
ncbi:hypothetical protein BABINDRAFT_160201 [Babjeviella inositovora NRRL Y-12698]|uniref:Uncharacterized protein n=1 Tax=Babjeviella inositovora NRRL Y-12698 TaxID=984486 RepID=A0A1E3QWD5_9ASCO|nr:uncharacterized protein BABINDRAFT_160201 [Babjeviella inositovora NRRL Y-12698]ODQ81985.1 hypothetical protein BABINDRAFT_160201 [Babjeviella inositovora NRRL Y-12698]